MRRERQDLAALGKKAGKTGYIHFAFRQKAAAAMFGSVNALRWESPLHRFNACNPGGTPQGARHEGRVEPPQPPTPVDSWIKDTGGSE
jgi:hypothetical protein